MDRDESILPIQNSDCTRRVDWTTVDKREATPMLTTILIIILILALVGLLPTWPYSRGWGYGPGGLVGLALIILLILVLTGRA